MANYGAIGVSSFKTSRMIVIPVPLVPIAIIRRTIVRAIVVREPIPLSMRSVDIPFRRLLPMWAGSVASSLDVPTNGTITGTVAVGLTPAPYSTVCLYYRPSGILIYKIKTDENGAFVFKGLDPTSNEYFAVAYDPSAVITFDSLLIDRITPKLS